MLSLHLGEGPVHDDEVEAHGDDRESEEKVQRARRHEQGVPAAAAPTGGRIRRLRRLGRRRRQRGRRGRGRGRGRSLEDADGGEGGEAEVEAVRRRPAAQGAEGEK